MFKNNSEKLRLSDGDFSIENILKRLDLPKKEKKKIKSEVNAALEINYKRGFSHGISSLSCIMEEIDKKSFDKDDIEKLEDLSEHMRFGRYYWSYQWYMHTFVEKIKEYFPAKEKSEV